VGELTVSTLTVLYVPHSLVLPALSPFCHAPILSLAPSAACGDATPCRMTGVTSGDTIPCRMTGMTLHGIVSPDSPPPARVRCLQGNIPCWHAAFSVEGVR
jgi:hypothetical protein